MHWIDWNLSVIFWLNCLLVSIDNLISMKWTTNVYIFWFIKKKKKITNNLVFSGNDVQFEERMFMIQSNEIRDECVVQWTLEKSISGLMKTTGEMPSRQITHCV